MSSYNWPPVNGAGIPIYTNVAAFPVGTVIGQQAIDASGIPNIYEWDGAAWVVTASGGVALSVGTFDGQTGQAKGLDLVSNVLYAQSASATVPGMINLSDQTLGTGNKRFSTSVISPLFQSSSVSPATAGVLRLGNNELIEWRTQNNGANRTLGLNSSNVMESTATFQTDGQLISTATTGTAPLVVSSTTLVANLNVATSGTAAVATQITTTLTTTNASFFPLLVASSSSGNQGADMAAGLSFNPSTNALTTTTFVGALTGNATTATTATNATNVATTATNSTNATFYPAFVASPTSANQGVDTATGLTFNPSTNALTTTTFSGALSGNATSATTSTNVSGGTGGELVYNTGASTTAFISNGTVGKILSANGTTLAPSWVSLTAASTLPTLLLGSNAASVLYSFYCSPSANATLGATYSNNGNFFTVFATISGSPILILNSIGGGPTASGTLTKTTGTGDSTITFTQVGGIYLPPTPAPLYLKLTAVGGGGGGAGGNTNANYAGSGGGGGGGTDINFCEDTFFASAMAVFIGRSGAGGTAGNPGAAGQSTIFGVNGNIFVIAGGGSGGTAGGQFIPGVGGAPGQGTGVNINGAYGQNGGVGITAVLSGSGGSGGSSSLGGGGLGAVSGASAGVGLSYGGGGGGACATGGSGGAGADGLLIIEAYYQ